MTSLTIILVASSTVVWGSAVFIVPQHVNSLFRYRLWRLRDDLQDYIFDGQLPDSPAVRELQEGIEALIQHSETITLSAFLAHYLAVPKADTPTGGLSSLPFTQQRLIFPLLAELLDSIDFKKMAGSPGGALFLPFWLIWFHYHKRPSPIEPEKGFRQLRELRDTLGTTSRDKRDLIASVG